MIKHVIVGGAQNRETFLSKTQTEVRVKWKYGLQKEKITWNKIVHPKKIPGSSSAQYQSNQ